MRGAAKLLITTCALFGLGGTAGGQTHTSVPTIEALGTTPTERGGSNKAIFLLSGEQPLIVGTAELGRSATPDRRRPFALPDAGRPAKAPPTS